MRKATYVGWRDVEEGKHEEAAFFVYYSRKLGAKTYIAVRKMKNGGPYKPYEIMSEAKFNENVGKIKKGKPPQ